MKWTFLIPPVLNGSREVERVFGCTYGLYPIPNIFILYNASVARNSGCDVSYLDCVISKWHMDDLVKHLQGDNSNVYVFYTVNLAKNTDLAAAEMIKSYRPNAWIIFMGPAPTYEPDEYLLEDRIIVVRGEMEDTVAELSKILSRDTNKSLEALDSCKGISYRINTQVKHNPQRNIISDIDKLPLPARDLLQKTSYFNPKLGVVPFTVLLTSRGCSFRCRYCVPNSLSFARELEFRKKINNWNKPKVTVRSFESVYEELLWLKKNKYRAIAILDDQFIWNGEREIKLAEAMGKFGFLWGCLSRGERITDQIAEAFGRNKCKYVDIGVESFCQKILDDVGKGTAVEKIYKGIETLKKYNVPFKLNILLGASPLENSETIKHTLAMAKKLEPSSIMVGICNPFPGTEFWEIAKRERWLLTPNYQPVDVQKEAAIAYPHLSKKDLEKAARSANLNFFLRPRFILKTIINTKSPVALVKSSSSLFKKLTKP